MNAPLYRWLDKIFFPHETAILMYHGFTDQTAQIENYHGKHLHIDTFRKHLEYLKKYYHIISLDDFVKHCSCDTAIPKRSAVLTFDDGYESNFCLAYPVLKEFNAPATIFLTTDFIGQKQFLWSNRLEYTLITTDHKSLSLGLNGKELTFDCRDEESKKETINALKPLLKSLDPTKRELIVNDLEHRLGQKLNFYNSIPAVHRPLSWPQIQEMSQNPLISFGAHTCSHAILTQCAPEAMHKELTIPKKTIEDKLNKNCDLFCYPYGGPDTFDHQSKQGLQKEGYRCALTTITGTNNRHSDLFTLRRFGTSNLVGMDNFTGNLLSSYKLLRRLRNKLF